MASDKARRLPVNRMIVSPFRSSAPALAETVIQGRAAGGANQEAGTAFSTMASIGQRKTRALPPGFRISLRSD